MKRIGIDCRLAGTKHAGIGRYIEELVKRVIKDRSTQWVLFFSEPKQIALPAQDNVRIVLTPVRHYSLAEQIWMPISFYREKLDLLHIPHYNVPLLYQKKFVVTIHDLLWHTEKNAQATTLTPFVHALKHWAYQRVVAHALWHADTIVVPARVVKDHILHLFPSLPAQKIVPVLEGVSDVFCSSSTRVSSGKHAKKLLYVGSLYPHKNVLFVVKALKQLPEYELYISSSRSVFVQKFMREVEEMGMADRVHHLGRLSDQELCSQYQESFAVVQPSLSEGFGLTGIEAMSAGVPVLASDIPIFTEVYKDAHIPFDPHSQTSFIQAVHRLETSNRAALIKKGQQVASGYDWKLMADEIQKIYQAV